MVLCAGKSSLLAALLGEMYSKGGTVTVAGSTGYAAQDPWIQNATLRDNILMGSDFNQDRYGNCLHGNHSKNQHMASSCFSALKVLGSAEIVRFVSCC